jgi:multicomponent Na+:H+ antiporter subunit D
MLVAMGLFAALCIGLGVWATPLYAMLPHPVAYQAYTATHLVAQFQLLLFAGLAFFVMLPMMKRTLTITLDFDYFYRRFFISLVQEFSTHGQRTGEHLAVTLKRQWRRLLAGAFRHHGPQGILARSWPTGSMAIWVAIVLAASLLLYYAD